MPHDDQLRDGLIQRFEFTYELCTKTLRRYLELAADVPGAVDAMDFADTIRTANEQGILRGDWSAWKRFRELWGRTSHAYDEAIAKSVAAAIPEFLTEATELLHRVEKRVVWP